MKFCLSSRQSPEYLAKADEIKVAHRDYRIVPELFTKYPKADVVLEWRSTVDTSLTREKIIEFGNLSNGKLIVCVDNISPEINDFFNKHNIRYFWGYDITDTYELESIKKFYNVCYVRIQGPLFFQQDLLAKFGIPVRAVPNIAHFNYLPHEDGVNGCWIRPEDLEKYEPVITAVEFEDCDRTKEQALYRIYAEEKEWSGKLSYLITNLGKDCTNRMLPPEFTEKRMNCGQKCTAFGACRLCYRYFALADPELLKKFKENS